MENEKRQNAFQNLAYILSEQLNSLYGGEVGFFLCVQPTEECGETDGKRADYISNCIRSDTSRWLRDTADYLDATGEYMEEEDAN